MDIKKEVLKIISDSKRKLNPIEIIKNIKEDYSAEDLRVVLDAIDELCKEGLIRSNPGNTYFKNNLLYGTIDVHEKGNAHLLMKDGEDIYIKSSLTMGAHDKDKVLVDMVDKKKNS